jgi:hypothetical protein
MEIWKQRDGNGDMETERRKRRYGNREGNGDGNRDGNIDGNMETEMETERYGKVRWKWMEMEMETDMERRYENRYGNEDMETIWKHRRKRRDMESKKDERESLAYLVVCFSAYHALPSIISPICFFLVHPRLPNI